MVSDNAHLENRCHVYGDARVFGSSEICDNANIYGNSAIFDNAMVYENAIVEELGSVNGNARVRGNCRITGIATISSNANVEGGIIDAGDISKHAFIRSNNDYFSLLFIDFDITAYRSFDDYIYINYNRNDNVPLVFRLEEFEKEVKKNGNSNNHSEKGNDRRVDGEQEGSR